MHVASMTDLRNQCTRIQNSEIPKSPGGLSVKVPVSFQREN